MKLFLTYVLPIVVVTLGGIFLRTCVRIEGRKIPRLLIFLMIGISFIPIVGIAEIVIVPLIFTLVVVGAELDCEIIENSFTRFWIKS